jgi:ADP-ribose pyrophosphatase YjhB (NUDIX family)
MATEIPGDGELYAYHSNGQDWLCAWHPAALPAPEGKRHGSAAVCITRQGEVVLVTEDGAKWGLPGGRPERDEDWRETLDREVLEEACARVAHASLLGYGWGKCVRGQEEGLVLVRSLWVATVDLEAWEPCHEITDRLLTEPRDALERVMTGDPNRSFRRLFREAFPQLG